MVPSESHWPWMCSGHSNTATQQLKVLVHQWLRRVSKMDSGLERREHGQVLRGGIGP